MSSADVALAVLVAAEEESEQETVECQETVSSTVDRRGVATHADMSPAAAKPSPTPAAAYASGADTEVPKDQEILKYLKESAEERTVEENTNVAVDEHV